MLDRIRDWSRPILQVCGLFLIVGLCIYNYFFDIVQILTPVFTLPIIGLTIKINIDGNIIKLILGFLFILTALWIIRSWNEEHVLKQTLTNKIVWHSYYGYLFCNRILNYKKVSLTRVPIPMQFKLVCNNAFEEFKCEEGVCDKKMGTDNVRVKIFNDEKITPTVNLVLADTYPLNWRKQIPETVINFTTIIVDRSNDDRSRYYSPDFISRITREVRSLPEYVNTINLFATINTKHSYHIAMEVFSTGGRDGIKSLNVYEQSNDDGRKFIENKYIKIF